uniref:hypothetical protein n=1 Tax=uncultured Bosea sp. TaxID=211457 RepID=UPI0025E4BA91
LRNSSLFPLTALLLLAGAVVVLAGGRTIAPVSSALTHIAHQSSSQGGGNADPSATFTRGNISMDQEHVADMANGLPCDVACLVNSSGCVAPPPISRDGFLQRAAGAVCLHPGNDLMLDGVIPDARLKPPQPIA